MKMIINVKKIIKNWNIQNNIIDFESLKIKN